ncbi:hypothetical protein [Streptomyces sp. NPDC048392]|uniref:hypothetical protein n=1 Tax=Streptomyces sp. NPDC048392 TaxID=3365543 RepID=UPI003713D3E7
MENTSFGAAILKSCFSAAVAAPSIHNTQPWRFRLDSDTVTFQVCAAPERGMRQADPTGRALLLSVGACVFNLRVALAHFGWSPVTHSLPSPEDPGLLATVWAAELTARTGEELGFDLYEAIWRRHSSRFPFSDRPLPVSVCDELRAVARAEGAWLHFSEGVETTRLLRMTAEAERRNRLHADRAARAGTGCTGIWNRRPTRVCRERPWGRRTPGRGSCCATSPHSDIPKSSPRGPSRRTRSSPC